MAAVVPQALVQGATAAQVLGGPAQGSQLAMLSAAERCGLRLHYPAAQGLLPQTLSESQRAQANALYRTDCSAVSVSGAAVGVPSPAGLHGAWPPTRQASPLLGASCVHAVSASAPLAGVGHAQRPP